MPMTVIVTNSVEARYRGFLSSCMLEITAGCYVAPSMSAGVRERVWAVLRDWHLVLAHGTILAIWPNKKLAGGIEIRMLGEPLKDLIEIDGLVLTRKG